ncbi:MAG: alpha-1,2-fucosyltransferase [Lachnospiraceae bacterium]|nr:alpha-1,2-fucosyltransferase [Lachnospiraceae bacterium]
MGVKKIYVAITDGLGNQLFCYALGYAVSKKKNCKLILDTSKLDSGKIKGRKIEISSFNLKYDDRIKYKYIFNPLYRKLKLDTLIRKLHMGFGTRQYREKKHMEYDSEVFDIRCNTYFEGYWQCFRYFDAYKNDLKEMFVPQRALSKSAEDMILSMSQSNSVALHVRRGDYLDAKWNIPMHYYDQALERLRNELDCTIKVYIFSDDKEYAINYFSKMQTDDIEFIAAEYESENYSVDDIYLMSKCKNNIIANSTYSWWAAYLNGNKEQVVICPEYSVWSGEFYPENWIKIKVK